MNNLERWFLNTTEEGNRNHMLIRFGYALLDDGYKLDSVREAILSFNQKLNNPLPEDEILMTIMVSLTKKFTEMNME